jgi:two-component system, response regulator
MTKGNHVVDRTAVPSAANRAKLMMVKKQLPSTTERGVDILIVDDDATDAHLTVKAIEKAMPSITCEFVGSGEDALDFVFCRGAYAARHFDHMPKLVLLDLKLPGMPGIDVLRELKNDERTKYTPVVVMTSSRDESQLDEAYEIGVNSYIVKPVDALAYADVVQKLGKYWVTMNEQAH